MDRDQAKDYINEQEPTFLTKAKIAGYICPYCKQGSNKGHGITRNSRNKLLWHCTNERASRSVLGLFAGYIGIEDTPSHLPEILEKAAEYYGIALDAGSKRTQTEASKMSGQNQDKSGQYTHTHTHTDVYTHTHTHNADQEPEKDYTAYYMECAARITETNYHRGLSLKTLVRFTIGYDPAWRHPKVVAEGKNPPPTPRLIIPTSDSSYLARDTRQVIPEAQEPYKKSKVGRVHTFNLNALYDSAKPIFILEGEIDALSVCDVGGSALALGSTSYKDIFLNELDTWIKEKGKPTQPFILSLDNDAAGKECSDKLTVELGKRGITSYRYNLCGDYKDANEALMKNREALAEAVAQAENIENQAEDEEKEAYLRTTAGANLQQFIDGIAESVNTPCLSTGFKVLDSVLDGGLYEGLITVGAISSLGKTSLILQIADQVAEAGNDVLIFSLEMARAELMSKSISRHTVRLALDRALDVRLAKSARGITDGKRHANYTQDETRLIQDAISAYSKYADRLFIQEGIGNIGVEQIRQTITKHIHFTGRRPLVIVDYLQILAPYSERMSDKQNMDKAILELKRISRDLKIPVIAISSFNRGNYKAEADFEAFKESGAIEYGSDIVIGLQLQGAGDKNFDYKAEKQKYPRKVEAVILKNRQGKTGDNVLFEYYTVFNYFREKGLS